MTGNKSSPALLTWIYKELLEKIPGPGRLKEGLALYFWPRVAGKELQAKARAERVSNGILWVKCPDPAFSYNLHFFKTEILKKYRRILGAGVIRSVRIVTGEIEDPPQMADELYPRRVEEPRGKFISPPEIKEVTDSGLKEAYIRFYNLCKIVGKSNGEVGLINSEGKAGIGMENNKKE
ncbi:MAG TPA: DUF721 domain-containing protein [Firmicutes bacterium]|nr:DUF721 domain-containing protein [Bacillota bacterium]